MTIFSISLSTLGLWLELLTLQVGLQFRHSNYEAPYLHLGCFFGSVTLSLHRIWVRGIDDWSRPFVYRTVWEYPKPEGITVTLTMP